MSSAICLNLVQSKILSFGNGLNKREKHTHFEEDVLVWHFKAFTCHKPTLLIVDCQTMTKITLVSTENLLSHRWKHQIYFVGWGLANNPFTKLTVCGGNLVGKRFLKNSSCRHFFLLFLLHYF